MNIEKTTNEVVEWVRNIFKKNNKNIVIGISGGKDSTVTAKICVEAVGKDRILGVIIPNGIMNDMDTAGDICKYLNITPNVVNIAMSYLTILEQIQKCDINLTEQTKINLAPRLRMSVLYAVAQSSNALVVNTSNFSERYIGYSTLYGDGVGDFAPLFNLTVWEVIQIGRCLGIPEEFLLKPPSDGLTGKTDEDNLGFSYDVLDKYLLTGKIEDM